MAIPEIGFGILLGSLAFFTPMRAQAPRISRAVVLKPASRVDTQGERRLALVIGNDTYQSVAPLQNAKADAQAIAGALEQMGFQVMLKLDQTEKGMKADLRTFKSQIRGGDVALFYYSGHGVQIGGSNMLLPVDAHGESEDQVRDEAIPLQRILDDLQDQKAKFSLAIVDACRNNPFKGMGRSIGGRGLAPTTAATGQMVLYSAGTGQEALDRLGTDDRNPNGLFTRVLVNEIRKPGIPVDRMLRNVRNEVVRLASGVGHEQVPALYDQSLGDFYFVSGSPESMTPASAELAKDQTELARQKQEIELARKQLELDQARFQAKSQSPVQAMSTDSAAIEGSKTVNPLPLGVSSDPAQPTAWLDRISLIAEINKQREHRFFIAWVDGRIGTSQYEYRAIFQPFPKGHWESHYCFGRSRADYEGQRNEMAAKGIKEIFHQVFKDRRQDDRYQACWLKVDSE
jgi:uncharacterized caspase-like protein